MHGAYKGIAAAVGRQTCHRESTSMLCEFPTPAVKQAVSSPARVARQTHVSSSSRGGGSYELERSRMSLLSVIGRPAAYLEMQFDSRCKMQIWARPLVRWQILGRPYVAESREEISNPTVSALARARSQRNHVGQGLYVHACACAACITEAAGRYDVAQLPCNERRRRHVVSRMP